MKQLSSFFIKHNEKLVDVYYFTAYAEWLKKRGDSSPVLRHKIYTQFLESHGIKIVLGKFKTSTKKCNLCKKVYSTHEEKETDVNISVMAMKLLYENSIDKLIIVSADSDLIPPVKEWKKLNKEISFLLPPTRKNITKKIQSHFTYQIIKKKHLQSSLLPASVTYKSKTIYQPEEYKQK